MSVVPLRPKLYEAKPFEAFGVFKASGTLCGHIDFVGPWKGSIPLTPDEVLAVITMLQGAREDVLANSDLLHDPRLFG